MKKSIFTLLLSLVLLMPLVSDSHTLERINYIPKKHLIEMVKKESGITVPDSMEYYHIWLIYETASQLDIPIRIAFRMFKAESNFNPNAINPISSAIGYGQMLKSTWLYMLLKNGLPLDTEMTPERNIVMCLMYYDYLRSWWRNRGLNDDQIHKYVLASYNAGKGKVLAHRGIPPFQETINYVNFIQGK